MPNRLDDGFTIFSGIIFSVLQLTISTMFRQTWQSVYGSSLFSQSISPFTVHLSLLYCLLRRSNYVSLLIPFHAGWVFQFSIFLHRRHGNFLSRGVSRLVASCIITTDFPVPFDLSSRAGVACGKAEEASWSGPRMGYWRSPDFAPRNLFVLPIIVFNVGYLYRLAFRME